MTYARVKQHIKDHKELYIGLGIGVGLAGITALIMRTHSGSTILRDTVVEAQRDIVVLGKNATLNKVSYFDSLRQGPPSWVVRCLETGQVFTSQRAAALAMDLSEANLSQHLNGVRDHVNNFHFERICLAA